MAKILLGLDPGLADTGWGLILFEAGRAKYLRHGCIKTAAGEKLETRLLCISLALQDLLREFKPDAAAVESLFFAKNVTSAMAVAHARGVIYLELARAGLAVFEYTPLVIKQAVVGNGKADKAQVQAMVKVLLGLSEIPKPNHAADALAAAICLAHTGVA